MFGETAMVCLIDKWQGFPKCLEKIGRWRSPSLNHEPLNRGSTGDYGECKEREQEKPESHWCHVEFNRLWNIQAAMTNKHLDTGAWARNLEWKGLNQTVIKAIDLDRKGNIQEVYKKEDPARRSKTQHPGWSKKNRKMGYCRDHRNKVFQEIGSSQSIASNVARNLKEKKKRWKRKCLCRLVTRR